MRDLSKRILGNSSEKIENIIRDITSNPVIEYEAYHSKNHLYKVTICFIALKNYLREEITEEEIMAALLHDYRYKRACTFRDKQGVSVEEASVNFAFTDGLFSDYTQFSKVRDLVMETAPHGGFKIIKHPLQVAEIAEGSGTTMSPKECFDLYGKTFCFGVTSLNDQKILLHNSSFD